MQQGNLTQFFGGDAFNSNAVEASQPFEVMPKHWATATITESELKPTGVCASAPQGMHVRRPGYVGQAR